MSKNEEKISTVSSAFRHETVMDFIKKTITGETIVDLTLRDGTKNRNPYYDKLESLISDLLDESVPQDARVNVEKTLFHLIITMRLVNRITDKNPTNQTQQDILLLKDRLDKLEARIESTNKLVEKIIKTFPTSKDPEP